MNGMMAGLGLVGVLLAVLAFMVLIVVLRWVFSINKIVRLLAAIDAKLEKPSGEIPS